MSVSCSLILLVFIEYYLNIIKLSICANQQVSNMYLAAALLPHMWITTVTTLQLDTHLHHHLLTPAHLVSHHQLSVCVCVGCIYSLDWTTGLDYWTGLLD